MNGFELPTKGQLQRHIWVDPESHLPVREEVTPLAPDHPRDDNSIPSVRLSRCVVTYQFNVELPDDLFSLDPPDGYKLVDMDEFQMPGMELPSRPSDLDALEYMITPSQGIGRARFGMTKQEVITALGEPDSFNRSPDYLLSNKKRRRL